MSTKDARQEYDESHPEWKIELIDGRLVIGNSLRGSRYILWELLHHYGPDAAFPMASEDLWWQALAKAFRHLGAPRPGPPAEDWCRWAEDASYQPVIEPAGPFQGSGHWATRDCLKSGFYYALGRSGLGESFGPDCVVLLGENAFTPDVFVIGREQKHRSFRYHFDGPPKLIVEVLMPGHETQDTEVKRRYYEEAGVPEYWTIDPAKKELVFLRLGTDGYRPATADGDGRYRPAPLPGLTLVIDERLWRRHDFEKPPFEYERVELPEETEYSWDEGPGFGDKEIELRIDLDPLPLRFDEFLCWCPRAKFESDGHGAPFIGRSRWGTRGVLAMLLTTFGLTEAVTVLPPQVWVKGLVRYYDEDYAARERTAWWELARRAAALVREQFRTERLAVIGDLVRSARLSAWCDLDILSWGLEEEGYQVRSVVEKALGHKPRIYVLKAEEMEAEELEKSEAEAVDL